MTNRKTESIPMPDFGGIFRAFASPVLDLAGIADMQRKNMEALMEANRVAAEGYQVLLRRQAEILQESVSAASDVMHTALRNGNSAEKGSELARTAMEQGFAHMRELAELVSKAHTDAFSVVQARMKSSLDELRAGAAPESPRKKG